MKVIFWITVALELAIVSPLPALDRWQANFRAEMRAGLRDYLPENPHAQEERRLLREICALQDSAYERE